MQAFFDALEVDATDAWALFRLIDSESTHSSTNQSSNDGASSSKSAGEAGLVLKRPAASGTKFAAAFDRLQVLKKKRSA